MVDMDVVSDVTLAPKCYYTCGHTIFMTRRYPMNKAASYDKNVLYYIFSDIVTDWLIRMHYCVHVVYIVEKIKVPSAAIWLRSLKVK